MKGFFLLLKGRSDKSTSRSLQIWVSSSMVNLFNLSERTRSHTLRVPDTSGWLDDLEKFLLVLLHTLLLEDQKIQLSFVNSKPHQALICIPPLSFAKAIAPRFGNLSRVAFTSCVLSLVKLLCQKLFLLVCKSRFLLWYCFQSPFHRK